MNAKFVDILRSVTPGGVVRSKSGAVIHVSSNGTSTVPAQELEKIVLERFGEMAPPSRGALAPEDK